MDHADTEIPCFIISLGKQDNEYKGRIDYTYDAHRPWMSRMLDGIEATGTSEDDVISRILSQLSDEFYDRYQKRPDIQENNYSIEHYYYE